MPVEPKRLQLKNMPFAAGYMLTMTGRGVMLQVTFRSVVEEDISAYSIFCPILLERKNKDTDGTGMAEPDRNRVLHGEQQQVAFDKSRNHFSRSINDWKV